MKIIGGTILHGGTTANGAICLRIGVTYNVYIENTNMIVYGSNGHCIETPSPSGYNIEINGGNYWNNSDRYSSRCQYDGCAIRLRNGLPSTATYPDYQYHYKVHDITIHNTPGQGILFGGRDQGGGAALTYCYNNSFVGDARNLTYTTYSGTCQSSANPYAIAILKGAPGSKIYGNTITSGDLYGGCRGILIENSTGAPGNMIEVYDNYVDIHEGPNVEYGDGLAVHGLRIRAIDGGTVAYLWAHHNTFICTGDNLPSTQQYNSSVMPCRLSLSAAEPNITIENNIFRAKSLTSGVESKAVVFDLATGHPTLQFRHNRIEGDGALVQWGNSNSGAHSVTIYGDTLTFLSPTYDPQTFLVGHLSNNWDCHGNNVCDAVYLGGASDNDVHFANGGTLELGLQRTLSIIVNGRNDLPVRNASVSVVNNYGNTVLSGMTDAYGRIEGIVTYWWGQRVGSDSTNYNDFTIKAKKETDSTIVTLTVNATSSSPDVTLQNTDGDGDPIPEDTTAPGRILDLGAIEAFMNSITIAWTAPGDDGNVGRASAYDVRYYQENITPFNWDQASRVSGEPAPKAPGESERFTVSGLDPGTSYFFAVRTVDDAGNWSQISNVTNMSTLTSEDETPPSAIDDLVAATGFNIGDIIIAWSATGDDGRSGAARNYEIRYSQSSINPQNWSSLPVYTVLPSLLDAGSEMMLTMSGLEPGALYYIGIKAFDEANNASNLSNIASAEAQYDLVLEDDGDTVKMMEPVNGAVVKSSQPILVIKNIDSSRFNVYYFELDEDSDFMNPIAADTVLQQQGELTTWKIPVKLTSRQTYFWRARVNNSDFTDFASFQVSIDTHVYPNPFDLTLSSIATFTELPENVNLILMTVSGNMVREWHNITGGQITWDGTNESGERVASGTYLWFVENTDLKGKIIVIR